MDSAEILRHTRHRAGLTLRALAAAAHTSHSALAAYEAGRVTPTVDTFERIMTSAGFNVMVTVEPRVDTDDARGRELIEVLELAATFPARHRHDIAVLPFPGHDC